MNKLELSTEDYVSFEIAKLLKEKGFDEATNRYYNAQYDQIRTVSDTFMWHWNDEEFMKSVLMEGAIAVPTLQMAMKWLREKHKITIGIVFKGDRIYYEIHQNNEFVFGVDTPKSYEKVCDEAIKYCLTKLM